MNTIKEIIDSQPIGHQDAISANLNKKLWEAMLSVCVRVNSEAAAIVVAERMVVAWWNKKEEQ